MQTALSTSEQTGCQQFAFLSVFCYQRVKRGDSNKNKAFCKANDHFDFFLLGKSKRTSLLFCNASIDQIIFMPKHYWVCFCQGTHRRVGRLCNRKREGPVKYMVLKFIFSQRTACHHPCNHLASVSIDAEHYHSMGEVNQSSQKPFACRGILNISSAMLVLKSSPFHKGRSLRFLMDSLSLATCGLPSKTHLVVVMQWNAL